MPPIIDAFPVLARRFKNGAVKTETLMKAINRTPIEDEVFAPPTG